MVFEGYAELLANKYGMRKWESFEHTKRPATKKHKRQHSSQSLGDVYYGFVMQSVTSMFMAARHQRFYPSLVASYHGLSLMGMDMLSSYGFTMPSTSFLHQRHVALDNHDITIRCDQDLLAYVPSKFVIGMLKRAHVTWWDNFCKPYRVRMADTARVMLKDALWTGVAIRQYAGSVPVDMRCVHFGGYFVPAMPTNPWSKVKDVLTTGGSLSMLFEGSNMHV